MSLTELWHSLRGRSTPSDAGADVDSKTRLREADEELSRLENRRLNALKRIQVADQKYKAYLRSVR